MGVNQAKDAITWINELPWPLNLIVWAILFGGILVFFLTKTVKIVHKGECAMRTRRGRLVERNGEVVVYHPGMCFLIPFVDTLVRVSVRDRTFNLGTTNIKSGEYDVSDVDATITLSVLPDLIDRLQYKNDELERRIIALSLSLLRPVLNAHKAELGSDGPNVRESIAHEFALTATPVLADLGFTQPIVEVTDVRPNAQALIAKAIASSTSRPSLAE